jgi:ankyrin repeat protein
MSTSEVLRNGADTLYRPEVLKLEQQWRRKKEEEKERMARWTSLAERDSGMCEEAISGVILSQDSVQEPREDWKEIKGQGQRSEMSLRGPSDRLRESLHESGIGTMEVLSMSEDQDIHLKEPLTYTDFMDDGDLIASVEMPSPRIPEPEEVDDSPTPGQSVYHYFAVSEDPRYFLAAMRPFIMAQDEEGDTSLHHAIIHNRLPALYKLMDVVADSLWYCVNVQNKLGQTVLHLSAALKQYTAIRKFIEADARLDIQDGQGNSPIHIACRNGDLRAMKELLTDVQTPEGKVRTYEPEDLNRRNFSGKLILNLG